MISLANVATLTASAVVRTSSRRIIRARCTSTVRTLTPRSLAIALLGRARFFKHAIGTTSRTRTHSVIKL